MAMTDGRELPRQTPHQKLDMLLERFSHYQMTTLYLNVHHKTFLINPKRPSPEGALAKVLQFREKGKFRPTAVSVLTKLPPASEPVATPLRYFIIRNNHAMRSLFHETFFSQLQDNPHAQIVKASKVIDTLVVRTALQGSSA